MSQEMNNPPALTAAYTSLYGGAGLAVFGGLTAHDVAAIAGLVGTLGGLSVQAYYKRKDERRKQIVHDLEVAKRQKELQS